MDNQTPISTEEEPYACKKRKIEEPSSSEEVRNWLELPLDVLHHIFLKLGAIDILFRAQSVCSTWRRVSKDPLLFRSIDTCNHSFVFEQPNISVNGFVKMVIEAVKRSCGQLVELCIIDVEWYMDIDDIDFPVEDIADKFGSLRRLRLESCNVVSHKALIAMVEKSVMLEEVEICHGYTDILEVKTIGKRWPQLKSFGLTNGNCGWKHLTTLWSGYDEVIAKTMPQLRLLHLSMFSLTHYGLKAILDGCLHLHSLDIRQCKFNLEGDDLPNLEWENLLNSLEERLVELTLPDGSIDSETDTLTLSESSSYSSDGDEDTLESSSYSSDGDEDTLVSDEDTSESSSYSSDGDEDNSELDTSTNSELDTLTNAGV